MDPTNSTLACLLLTASLAIVTAIIIFQNKPTALPKLDSVSTTLRRMLVPPSSFHPESAVAPVNSNRKLIDWPQAMMMLCFLAGIGLPNVLNQIRYESRIPLQVMSVFIALAFSLMFVSSFIPTKYSVAAKKPMDWRQLVVTFCFAAGIGLLLVPDQIRRESPITFLMMPVLIALTFSFVFMSDFIRARYPLAAGAFEFVGVLFAGAAMFAALSTPLTMSFKWLLWVVYAGAVAVVLIMNLISSSSP